VKKKGRKRKGNKKPNRKGGGNKKTETQKKGENGE
jgi:hypothetical protein